MYVTRDKYYSDGKTEVTSPFFPCLCPEGHTYWSITPVRTCYFCGKRLVRSQPGEDGNKKRAVSRN